MILQKIVFAFRALINSRIARIASTLNCKKKKIFVILIEIFILKTTMYHKYTLTYQKYKKKNVKNAISHSRSFWDRVGYDHLVILLAIPR
jgi:hypothetical protein